MSFDEKLAKLAVDHLVEVQPEESVLIMGNETVTDFIYTLYVEILKKQAFPSVFIDLYGLEELRYNFGSDEQLKYFHPVDELIAKVDKLIVIQSPLNTKALNNIDPKRIKIATSTAKKLEFRKTLQKRESEGKFAWGAFPYPSRCYHNRTRSQH